MEAAIDDDTALVSLSHVAFKSAFMYDMERVTELAHQAGALTLWDLSHAAGAVPLALNDCGADLAVGCTYKYLNGGPGSPAFLYVRRDLQQEMLQPIWGWFAAQKPFDFELDFAPAQGISRFRVGTPPVLSMLAIEPALDLLMEAWDRATARQEHPANRIPDLPGRPVANPAGLQPGFAARRRTAWSACFAAPPGRLPHHPRPIESPPPAVKVIPDFRTPDNIRLGVTPIYTNFAEIHQALERIRTIVEQKLYEGYAQERLAVT